MSWGVSGRNNYVEQSSRPARIHQGGVRRCPLITIGWPTPQLSDTTGGGRAKRADGRANLNDFAMLAGWPTPVANEDNKTPEAHLAMKQRMGERDGTGADRKTITSLQVMAQMAGWTTPQAHDETGRSKHQKEIHGTLHGCACLVNEARLTAFGNQPIGYLLGPNGWEIVPACGQLNAAHSRWLMGLPRVWDDCGVTAMASLRKSRPRSSKRTSKNTVNSTVSSTSPDVPPTGSEAE